MRRNIFHDKTNTTHTEIGKMIFRITSFEEILNYFKLGNNWLNSKLCAKRKLLRSDENAHVFFVKKEALNSLGNFVPLYFSPNVDILLPLFPGAVVELESSVFLVISQNYYTNYKHLVWLFGSKKGNINF